MTPFGDRAVRFAIAAGAPRRAILSRLSSISGVADVVLTEDLGCVVWRELADRQETLTAIAEALASPVDAPEDATTTTAHTLRVVYDGEDLDAVASAVGRTRDATIALHADREYRVAMLGFLPGFAYLRDVAESLRLPRRAPRARVPAGSVAIAARYTGVYPYASPGGWHLLGRAVGFEPFREGHATLAIGDVVRFSPTEAAPSVLTEGATTPVTASPETAGPHLEITRVAGFALFVDGGRSGRMHEGVPPGGPLVGAHFARANALARNDAGACAVELMGTLEIVARGGAVAIADERSRVELAEGERHVVSSSGRGRVTYLAIDGGVDAPIALGGRGALLVAGIGRLLEKGDRLVPGSSAHRQALRGPLGGAPEIVDLDAPVAVAPGPDEVPGFSLDALAGAPLRVSRASDRTGTRLEGWAPTERDASAMAARSAPMVRGAIELTPSGLIVLGPDHPTTGGYPVVGVVREASLDALFARPIGSAVRLVAT